MPEDDHTENQEIAKDEPQTSVGFPKEEVSEEYEEEEFSLKSETEYLQLILSVTSAEGKEREVSDFIKENINAEVVETSLENTVLSSPRDEYDSALSTIIDCPHTDNVLYKNEDYYPVACDIYENSIEDGKISEEAAEYIEGIEEMCKNLIIVIK